MDPRKYFHENRLIGKEQCAIVLRYVNDSYEVHEEFVGLYEADKVDAKSLVMIIKTTLLSLDIDIQNLRYNLDFTNTITFYQCHYIMRSLSVYLHLLIDKDCYQETQEFENVQ